MSIDSEVREQWKEEVWKEEVWKGPANRREDLGLEEEGSLSSG